MGWPFFEILVLFCTLGSKCNKTDFFFGKMKLNRGIFEIQRITPFFPNSNALTRTFISFSSWIALLVEGRIGVFADFYSQPFLKQAQNILRSPNESVAHLFLLIIVDFPSVIETIQILLNNWDQLYVLHKKAMLKKSWKSIFWKQPNGNFLRQPKRQICVQLNQRLQKNGQTRHFFKVHCLVNVSCKMICSH